MKFELFQSNKNQKFYFNLKARNGRIILSSQGYSTNKSCKKVIAHVIKHSSDPVSFKRKKTFTNLYSFLLLAPNGQAIGHSQSYTTKSAMEKGIRSVMKNGPIATVKDLSQNKQ